MITYITHIRVSPENREAFEAVMAEMTRKVRDSEPGVVHYGCGKSTEDPESYVVIEIYRDEAAFKAHWKTDYIRPLLAKATPLMINNIFDSKRYESI